MTSVQGGGRPIPANPPPPPCRGPQAQLAKRVTHVQKPVKNLAGGQEGDPFWGFCQALRRGCQHEVRTDRCVHGPARGQAGPRVSTPPPHPQPANQSRNSIPSSECSGSQIRPWKSDPTWTFQLGRFTQPPPPISSPESQGGCFMSTQGCCSLFSSLLNTQK